MRALKRMVGVGLGLGLALSAAACGTGTVPIATLAAPTSASSTSPSSSRSSTSRKPASSPTVYTIPGSGDPGHILGDTPGDYPGRIPADGADAAAVHRQVRAAMVKEARTILDQAKLRSRSTVVEYGRRNVYGRDMLKIAYGIQLSSCTGATKADFTTKLGAMGFTASSSSSTDTYYRGSLGDITVMAGPSSKGKSCVLALLTPYIPNQIDLTQFRLVFDDELAGKPAEEWPSDLGGPDSDGEGDGGLGMV